MSHGVFVCVGPWSVEPSSLVALFISLGICCANTLLLFFYEKRNFIMRLGVVEKAHWYGANIWSKNIFKVAFNFLFLDFLALTMFTNICITKFIFDHFWHVIMGPQTTYTMSNACFIFHGWCMVLLLINWMFCLWWWYKVIVCGKISKHVVCGVQFMYMFK